MLWILLAIFVVLIVIGTVMHNNYDDVAPVYLGIGWVGAIIVLVALLIVLGVHNSTKNTAANKIAVLEQNNEEVMTAVKPIIEKYLDYETESYKNLKIGSNTIVSLALYPELRGDGFLMAQLKIVISNNMEIKQLKLKQASLASYYFWIFRGE